MTKNNLGIVSFIKKVWGKCFKREPQFEEKTFKMQGWLTKAVADAQYEQIRNQILGIK